MKALSVPFARRQNWKAPRPSFVLDLTKKYLLPLTYTRTGPKTYYDATGALQIAADNEWPREYDPNTLACIGRSRWEGSTNLVTQSNDFSHTDWSKTRITVESAVASDDGGQCWKLICTGDADPFLHRTITPGGGALANRTFTWSVDVWTDVGQPTEAALFIYDFSVGSPSSIPLTLTSTPTRYTITKTFAAGETDTSLAIRIDLKNSPTTGDYVYARRGQLEEKAFATPYIPTTTVAVTRGEEVIKLDGTDYSDWYNQSEGTFVVKYAFSTLVSGVAQTIFNNATVSNTHRWWIGRNSSGSLQIFGGAATDGTLNFSLGAHSPAIGASQRIAVALKENDAAACLNGGAVTTDTACTMPTPTQISIGALNQSGTISSVLNGSIQQIVYYPQRLPNSTLQAFTAY